MNCVFGSPSHIPHYAHRDFPMTKKEFTELTQRNDMSVCPWRMHYDCLLCDEEMETEMDQYRYWAP